MPGRQCLECTGQYDMNLIQIRPILRPSRKGILCEPETMSLGFSISCAGLQFLQMLALVLSLRGQPNPGGQIYHSVGNRIEPAMYSSCVAGGRFVDRIGGEMTLGLRSRPHLLQCEARGRKSSKADLS